MSARPYPARVSPSATRPRTAALLALVGALSGCHALLSLRPGEGAGGEGPSSERGLDAQAERRPDARDVSLEGLVAERAPDRSPPDRPAPDHPPGTLYADDFAGGYKLVDDLPGSWSVQGGALSQTGCADAIEAVVPGAGWTDTRSSVRLRGDAICGQPAHAQVGLVLRVATFGDCSQGKDDYYVCVIDFVTNLIYAARQGGVCTTFNYQAASVALTLGAWYLLEGSIVGGTLTCRVSGPSLAAPVDATMTDPTPIPAGSAGLTTSYLSARFDDFLVRSY